MAQMTVSETLNKAADLIEGRGWWRSGGTDALSGKCAGNAITTVGGGAYNPAHTAFAIYLGGSELHDLETIWGWNDAQTDAPAVVEALRAAAIIEAAKETATFTVTPADDAASLKR